MMNEKTGKWSSLLRMKRYALCIVMLFSMGLKTATANVQQVWWTNHDNDDDAGWYYQTTPRTGRYHAATFIPRNFIGGAGTTIDGFSFFPYTQAMANVKVWVADKLPSNDSSDCLEVKDAGSLVLEKFNDVLFSRGYEIPEGGLYVGFSFDITNTSLEEGNRALLHTYTALDRDGAFYLNSPGGKGWQKVDGNLVVKVCFGSSCFNENSLALSNFDPAFALKGGTAQVAINVTNYGINDISNVSYVVTTDGVAADEQQISTSLRGFGSYGGFTTGRLTVPLPADKESGTKQKTVRITKINGTALDVTPAANGQQTTLEYQSNPTLVMEEYTGTWCGWCPRGIVGLQLVNETYGDRVQTIAVHYNDPMETSVYYSLLPGSFPNATVNRGEETDPYEGIISHIEEVLKGAFPGEITATARWANEAKTAIRIDTRTKFGFNDENAPFNIGYVLVEDGMKGSGSSWAQTNYYAYDLSYANNDPRLVEWSIKPTLVTNMVYDHVAVGGWGVHYGINGSISGEVVAGKEIESTYRADITTNKLIQDKSKLYVVALLIEKNSGKAYAAGKALIGDYQPGEDTGIADEALNDKGQTRDGKWYNLNGQRLSTPPAKGMYIHMGKKVMRAGR